MKVYDPLRDPLASSPVDNRPPGVLTKRWAKKDNGRTLPLNSAAWAKLRRYVLNGEPLCRHCAAQGLVVPATEVDHMHGAWDNRIDSLQPLCKSCHSRKTMAELHGRPERLGCDEHGYPIGSDHPWNQAAVARSGASGGHCNDKQQSPAVQPWEPTCSPRAREST